MAHDHLLQSTIEEVKNITKCDVYIFSTDCEIVAATSTNTSKYQESVALFVKSKADIQMIGGIQYFKIADEGVLEYVMLMDGKNEEIYTIGKLVAYQIRNLLSSYKDKFDRENYIKNLLLDNLLPIDIYNKAKKLHIKTDVRRIVFTIQTNKSRDNDSMEALKSLFAGSEGDFVTAVDENQIIVVKQVEESDGYDEMRELAETIVSLLNTEAMVMAKVSLGTIVDDLKDVSKSFKESKMALDVAGIFYEEKNIISYDNLGIGRLIFQLPVNLCEMFIHEVFPEITPDDFDEETLNTIIKFFENNLNVSETARQLYVHRNTLVYRIEKVSKVTGLDLRVFDDAITFQIALMVIKYIKYIKKELY